MIRDFPVSAEEVGRIGQRRAVARRVERLVPHLDPGIARYVEVLRLAGVETYESCQGGPDPERPDRGHAYPEPTVRFHGTQGADSQPVADGADADCKQTAK